MQMSRGNNTKYKQDRTLRNLIFFIVLVLLSGWLGIGLDAALGMPAGPGPGMLIWIIAPLALSFALRGFGGDGWSDLGIRPNLKGNWVWYGLSILVYPLCAMLVVVLGIIIGAVEPYDITGSIIALMAAVLIQTTLLQFVQNFFEESGFRGYLAPRAFSLGWNPLLVHVLVGLVWGAWHIPYLRAIIAPVAPYAAENMVILAPRFLLGAVAASLVYGEIRFRTNSIWPAVLMQSIGGSFIAVVVLNSGMIFDSGSAFIFLPMVEGLLMSLLFAIIGLVLYRIRSS